MSNSSRALVTVLAVVVHVSAARAAPRSVTLAQAREAVAHAPAHQVARGEEVAASESIRAAGAWPATSVGLSSSWRTAHVGAVASVPIPVFGTLAASRAVARAERDVARARVDAVDGDLTRDVTRAWLALAWAEARAEVSARAAERASELVRITTAQFEAGDAPRVDVVTARAGAARARADADADASAIDAASAELAALLGWDAIARLHADGGIPEPAAVPTLAALRDRRAHHPSVRVAVAEVGARAADVREVRAAHRPALAFELESLFDDPTLPGNDFRVGVSLEIPLFGRGGAARDAAVARRHTAELERAHAVTAVDAAIVAAHARYRAAAARWRALDGTVLPDQREAAELARKAYLEGQSGLVFVVEAERALADAEAQVIEARAEAARARAELEWAAGGAL